ncbi:MAG: lysylphosphatidylglycerol synthase transmembrane domain-containing protein [Clostridia bacterium]
MADNSKKIVKNLKSTKLQKKHVGDEDKKLHDDSIVPKNDLLKETQASIFDSQSIEQQTENKKIQELKEEVALEETTNFSETVNDENSPIIDSDVVKERLEEVQNFEVKKKNKKSKIFSVLFLLINIVLVVVLVAGLINSAGDVSISSIIAKQGNRLWWLLAGFVIMLLIMVADAFGIFLIIKKTTGKSRPVLSLNTAITGKYYESITPLAAGAQPSQIIYMSKRGVSPGIATSVPIIKMMTFNVMYIIAIVLFMVFAAPVETTLANKLILVVFKILSVIGVIVTTATTFLIILVGTSKVWGRSLARFCIKIGYKLRFVKNYRVSYDKLMQQVLEFQSSIDYLKKNKSLFFGLICSNAIQILLNATIPFIICLAFTNVTFASFGDALSYWAESIARFYICAMASSYIPLPGGTGMMELSFVAMFGTSKYMGTNIVWGFLCWRIITYYYLIIQGIVLMIVNSITSACKKKKIQKYDEKYIPTNSTISPLKIKKIK